MKEFEKRIGYTFKNKALLSQALTHSSCTGRTDKNYERLEFLGDRILGMTIADMLYQAFPKETEGALAQRFVQLVCKNTVADIMSSLDTENYISSITADIARKPNVLCDVGEAIIAAIYMDSGDLKEAQAFISRLWDERVHEVELPVRDYKSILQERSSALGLGLPKYSILEQSGTDHEPVFVMKATVANGLQATGEGHTKKEAEQKAACALLYLWDDTKLPGNNRIIKKKGPTQYLGKEADNAN